MPTVLVVDGFQVRIYLAPREHGPAHVHVVKAGAGEVVVNLGDEDTGAAVRNVGGMSGRDARRAFRIVEEHRQQLLDEWRRIHGE